MSNRNIEQSKQKGRKAKDNVGKLREELDVLQREGEENTRKEREGKKTNENKMDRREMDRMGTNGSETD